MAENSFLTCLVDTSISVTKSDRPLLETPESIFVVNLGNLPAPGVLSVDDAFDVHGGCLCHTTGLNCGGDALIISGP